MVWVVLCSEYVYKTCSYLKSYWSCYKRPQLSVRNYLLLPRAAVPGPDLRDWSDLIWQNVHDTAQRRSSSRQSSWELFRSARPRQEGGVARGLWLLKVSTKRHSPLKLGCLSGRFYQRSLKSPVNISLWTSVPTGGETLFKCPFIIASWCSICFQEWEGASRNLLRIM